MIDVNSYVLFQTEITKETGDVEEIIGYYVMATNLNILYSDTLDSLENVSNFNLLNSEGYILSNIDKLLMRKSKDQWFMEQINNQKTSSKSC